MWRSREDEAGKTEPTGKTEAESPAGYYKMTEYVSEGTAEDLETLASYGILYYMVLEEDGTAAFPDAPTERGLRHVEELTACAAAGYRAHLFFVIQMADIRAFRPNDRTHPAFGAALRAADGVRLHAHLCRVTPESLVLTDETVPILL